MANTKIKEYLKEKRDTLSASSLTTYASILKNLYTKVFDDTEYDMKKFEDTKKTMTLPRAALRVSTYYISLLQCGCNEIMTVSR